MRSPLRLILNTPLDYSSIKCNLRLHVYTSELECILNGLPWWRFPLSGCSNNIANNSQYLHVLQDISCSTEMLRVRENVDDDTDKEVSRRAAKA